MLECQKTFDKMKYVLTLALVLALPTFIKPFEVICDASIIGIDRFFLQKRRPIAFESFSLLKINISLKSKTLQWLCTPCALGIVIWKVWIA